MFLCMPRRRVSEETDSVIEAAINEIRRVEDENLEVPNKLDRFRKRRVGVAADVLIRDAVKHFMLKDDRFDYEKFRDELIEK